MTLREEITKSRNEMYDDVAKSSNQEDIELIIERIDKMDDRIRELESGVVNLNLLMDRIDRT